MTWYDSMWECGTLPERTRYTNWPATGTRPATLTHQRPPVEVQAIIDLAGIPVVERVLPDGTSATIGDIAERRSIILNRRWRFSPANERRWVLAEELAHVLMGHKLVESTEPGTPTIGLFE